MRTGTNSPKIESLISQIKIFNIHATGLDKPIAGLPFRIREKLELSCGRELYFVVCRSVCQIRSGKGFLRAGLAKQLQHLTLCLKLLKPPQPPDNNPWNSATDLCQGPHLLLGVPHTHTLPEGIRLSPFFWHFELFQNVPFSPNIHSCQ